MHKTIRKLEKTTVVLNLFNNNQQNSELKVRIRSCVRVAVIILENPAKWWQNNPTKLVADCHNGLTGQTSTGS